MTNRFLLLAIAFATACASSSHPRTTTTVARDACDDTAPRSGERPSVDVRPASTAAVETPRLGVEGGYNAVLVRWMNGESLERISRELGLEDKRSAREIVRKALVELQKQYYRDR